MKRSWKTAVAIYGVGCGGMALVLMATAGGQKAKAKGENAPPTGEVPQWVKKQDANGDGVLQPDEFPLEQKYFTEADTDTSGTLTVEEIQKLKRRYDALKAVKPDDKIKRKFAEADKNGDGVVSKDEFPATDMLFERFDRDGDGKVTYPEALAYAVEEEISKLFTEHDADLSGTLSVDEMPNEAKAKGIFELADKDGDGQVTGEEAYSFVYQARLGLDGKGGLKASPGESTSPSQAMVAETTKKAGVVGYLFATFDQQDADRDGAIAMAEFPASRELFDRLDIDRDGAIRKDEVQLRINFAKALGKRAERLKPLAKQLGMEQELATFGLEIKAMFEAGRYETVRRMLDEVELRVERRKAAGSGQ